MKRVSLLAAVLAALMLAGCGQKMEADSTAQQAPAQTAEQTANQTTHETGEQPANQTAAQTAGDQDPAAEGSGRAQTTELTFMLEGMEETVPATLYNGEGYSIYIFDEDWRLETDMEDGVLEEKWESTFNDDVELRVLHLGNRGLAEAQAFVKAKEDDYRFQEDKQGGLLGTDEQDRELMEVLFYPSDGAMFAVLYQYPEEAMEGFGARLRVMADTFERTT